MAGTVDLRGGRFSSRNREQKPRHPRPAAIAVSFADAGAAARSKKIPSVPVGIFLARRVLRRDARAPVGRSSLCDDENYAGGGGRVNRRTVVDNDEITPLPQRRAQPCMEFLARRGVFEVSATVSLIEYYSWHRDF